MGIVIADGLSPEESEALARFLIEMVMLERQISYVIAEHFAPTRMAEFEKLFLDRATLGTKSRYLRTVLEGNDNDALAGVADDLDHLVAVRNAVAHSLPTMGYDGEGDDIEVYSGYSVKRKVIKATDLDAHATDAIRLRIILGGWRPE